MRHGDVSPEIAAGLLALRRRIAATPAHRGDAGGNNERLALVYDRRTVTFCGPAAEVDAPRIRQNTEFLAPRSFWRAPYMCAFRSGNFDFIVIATHARWGDSIAGRQAELQMFADWIDERFNSQFAEDHDLIVMGDFNTGAIGDKTFAALTSRGLQIPACLHDLQYGDVALRGSNLNRNARYDQILHLPTSAKRFSGVGGVLDSYGSARMIRTPFPRSGYDAGRFSFQMLDHFPVWVQVNVDIDGDRFDQIVQNAGARKAA